MDHDSAAAQNLLLVPVFFRQRVKTVFAAEPSRPGSQDSPGKKCLLIEPAGFPIKALQQGERLHEVEWNPGDAAASEAQMSKSGDSRKLTAAAAELVGVR